MKTSIRVAKNKNVMQDVDMFIQSIMDHYYVSEDESDRLIYELSQLRVG